MGTMLAKPRSASAASTTGVFVRITLGDLEGRLYMNVLVWNNSFTTADELCSNEMFQRGSVRFIKLYKQ